MLMEPRKRRAAWRHGSNPPYWSGQCTDTDAVDEAEAGLRSSMACGQPKLQEINGRLPQIQTLFSYLPSPHCFEKRTPLARLLIMNWWMQQTRLWALQAGRRRASLFGGHNLSSQEQDYCHQWGWRGSLTVPIPKVEWNRIRQVGPLGCLLCQTSLIKVRK